MPEILELLGRLWRPAVEILILAVALYYVFTFVRGTRGAAIVTGFLVVMLTLAFVTSFMQLDVLRWILGSLTTFSAVAVLVIFQPEIRRMLAQVGNLKIFGTAQDQREAIEVIVQTVERLSDVRIGAIIAIEQTMQLHDVVENSIPVDCAATPEMLETIFFPNNAIHDGGVIIKGDRITYAACIFPLTPRQDLSKSMGTRHRAALGLSEESDAIVVVVSEETGLVSYAYKGQLVRGVSLEDLRAFLSSILVSAERPRSALGRLRALRQKKTPPEPQPAAGKAADPAVPKTQTTS